MADNYLEKRYDEVFNSPKVRVKRIGNTIDQLLLRNRSYRAYNTSFVVTSDMLRRIVSVCSRIPSARNQQALRFRLVTQGPEASAVLQNIRLGAALPHLNLPLPGTEPQAFIIACSAAHESDMLYIDLGIALQSMLLKTVEMGLGGIIIGSFNRQAISTALSLPSTPLIVLAIGKPAETVHLLPIHQGQSQDYFRNADGVHIVPKIQPDKLIINNPQQ